MSTTIALPSVFDYLDYRRYLKDYFDAKRKTSPGYSYMVFIQKAGISSRPLLVLIMQGKRNISKKTLPKFADALELNSREKKYFENLVSFNQTNDVEQKKYYHEKLLPIYKKERGKAIEKKQYAFLSSWHIPVILEMTLHEDFKADAELIAKRLKNKITRSQAEEALKLLAELNLITIDKDNKAHRTENCLITPDKSSESSVVNYHDQMIELAQETLKEDGEKIEKDIFGITAALGKEEMKRFRQHLYDFRNLIYHEFGNKNDEREKEVYQLNMQFFALTEHGEAKNEAK